MKVPNHKLAFISEEKIDVYLLNVHHPDGASKAQFFLQAGFDRATLRDALLRHIVENGYISAESNSFGTKYVVQGQINSPSGRSFNLRSVWVILNNKVIPQLVTAYPL